MWVLTITSSRKKISNLLVSRLESSRSLDSSRIPAVVRENGSIGTHVGSHHVTIQFIQSLCAPCHGGVGVFDNGDPSALGLQLVDLIHDR